MVLSFLIIIGLAIFIIAFLPQIIKQIKTAFPSKEEQVKQDAEEQERQSKGAIGNTVDFLFGAGTTAKHQEILDEVLTGKTSHERQVEQIEKSASENLNAKVTFPTDSVITITTDGKISSTKPPVMSLTQQEYDDIRKAFHAKDPIIANVTTSKSYAEARNRK